MSDHKFYDNFELCPKCGADNIVEILEFVQYHPAVATTVCTRCYHEDEWAFGWYKRFWDDQVKKRRDGVE